MSLRFIVMAIVVFFMGGAGGFVNGGSRGQAGELRLKQPGEVLFVRAVRHAELQAMPEELRKRLCGGGRRKWKRHGVVRTIRAIPGYGGDDRTQRFAWTVMEASAAAFGNDDSRARKALTRLLNRWAKGGGMTRLADENDPTSYYVVERTLLPTIVGYWLTMRGNPEISASVRRRVERWLGGLVMRSRNKRLRLDSRLVSARNNHAFLAASVAMAWGTLTGDLGLVETAVAVYRRAISEMRTDGSLPLETRRGARALWYQRHAIASLVVIAEMAAVQGIDLYGYRVGRRSLHAAIRFLLDGIEDPRRVLRYAKANVKPGPSRDYRKQDLGFLVRRAHGRHYMAWAEIYMARFPERPETRHLRRLLSAQEPHLRPMIDEYSGGNTSCFFYRPPANQRE